MPGSPKADPHADEIPPESQLDLATVEIILERTLCFGWCPEYTVIIDGSGRVHYTGRQYVKVIGRRESRIPEATVRALVDDFRTDGFFALESSYHDGWSDLPSNYVTLRVGNRRKQVESSWLGERIQSSGEEVPDWRIHEKLRALAASIDRAVGIESWIGTEEERARLFSQVGR